MCCPQRTQLEESEVLKDARRIEELRKRKTEALFDFLRKFQELNRQIKLVEIREDVAQLNRDYDKALVELFQREAK